MNIIEAMHKEFARGKSVIYVASDTECHACHKVAECRGGVCFDCHELVETDMIEVWLTTDPTNRWPYAWIESAPLEVTEEAIRQIQEIVDDSNEGGQ